MPNAPPMHTINGKQFSGEVDEYMKLSATEEWTLANDTLAKALAHPFHIHINPFQIVEWFDPDPTLHIPAGGVKMGHPWVWWDNFAIPAGRLGKDVDAVCRLHGDLCFPLPHPGSRRPRHDGIG
jgi:hypothetical protein